MTHSQTFDLQIRSFRRDMLPADGSVESWLTVRLSQAVDRGELGLQAVIVRPASVDLVDLAAAARIGHPAARLIAGLTSTVTEAGPVEAVGLWGRVERRDRRAPSAAIPVATVFLEWEDSRWWHWTCMLRDGHLNEDTIDERSALEGDAMPDGLGRWWTWARLNKPQVRLAPRAPVVH